MFDGDLFICELFDPELFRGAPAPTTAIALRADIIEEGGVVVLEGAPISTVEALS